MGTVKQRDEEETCFQEGARHDPVQQRANLQLGVIPCKRIAEEK
jgi:hypothetical protein